MSICKSLASEPTVLSLLAGAWRFERSIDDGTSLVGTATFVPNGAGRFDYREKGRLVLANGQTLDAERRYIFAEEDDGFAVSFAGTPPRLFHRIALVRTGPSLVGAATHLCSDDRYDSRYAFDADGGFVVEHRVCGPRKRYVMLTRYMRN